MEWINGWGEWVTAITKANHHPLVVIPGGPGLPHDYLETLEGAAKDDRVVVMFDPIGTGNSSALPAQDAASGLVGTSAVVAQVRAAVEGSTCGPRCCIFTTAENLHDTVYNRTTASGRKYNCIAQCV